MRQFVPHFARAAVALAAAAAFSSAAHAQQVVNLKMQATWPASLTLYENFTYFVERVGKISNGTLKIDAMPAGQVVPAFEVLDATHKKASRRRARLVGLLGRQEQGRDPVHRWSRRHLRHGHDRRHRLDAPRRRQRALQ